MPSSTPRAINKKMLLAGALAGAAAAAITANRRQAAAPGLPEHVESSSAPSEAADSSALIDWDRVRATATSMNRGQTLTGSERAQLDAYYQSLVERCIPIVEDYTGDALPPSSTRTFAFDRVDWINANIEAFKHVFKPVEELLAGSASGASASFGVGLNRQIASLEVGLLLGYMARRVLGQYDLALIGQDPAEAGKLYYVEPNIRFVERTLGMPRDDFRMWLALHETTHAFEFEAHTWVRGYFNRLLSEYLSAFKEDKQLLRPGLGAFKTIFTRVRARAEDESWIEAIMTPEQRAIFNRMQALMCMVEGYSNHVMNAVGRQLLPTYELIAKRFAERQQRNSPTHELFMRLTGLHLKMEQYRMGERFIDRIVQERGHDFARRIWDGPESLPTMEEIREPSQWLTRLDEMDRTSPASPASDVEIVEIRHWEA